MKKNAIIFILFGVILGLGWELRKSHRAKPVPTLSTSAAGTLTLQLENIPFCQAIDNVARAAGLQVLADWSALAAKGVEPNHPITRHLRALPVRRAIDLVLHDGAGSRVWYAVDQGVLEIHPADEPPKPVLHSYDIADLLASRTLISLWQRRDIEPGLFSPTTRRAVTLEEANSITLHNLILGLVDPVEWAENGGKATLNFVGQKMLITATIPMHEQVINLLDMLRMPGSSPPMAQEQRRLEHGSPLDRQIPATEFKGEFLDASLTRLAGTAGINLDLDWGELRKIDLDPSLRVAATVPAGTFKDALTTVLRFANPRFQVDCLWDGHVLTIGPLTSSVNTIVRAYDIADLLAAPALNLAVSSTRPSTSEEAAPKFRELIRETVDRESWIENGGRFGLLYFWNTKLVILQTPENHRKIEQLLKELRSKPPTSLQKSPPNAR